MQLSQRIYALLATETRDAELHCVWGVSLNSIVLVNEHSRSNAQRRKPAGEAMAKLVNTHVHHERSNEKNENGCKNGNIEK